MAPLQASIAGVIMSGRAHRSRRLYPSLNTVQPRSTMADMLVRGNHLEQVEIPVTYYWDRLVKERQ